LLFSIIQNSPSYLETLTGERSECGDLKMEGKAMKIPSPVSSLEAWEEVDDSSEEEEHKQPSTGTESKTTKPRKRARRRTTALKPPVEIHPTDRISL
jgi:hypothetical protein